MKKAIVFWYHYRTESGAHVIELEMINADGAVQWKRYEHKSREKVQAIAQAAETRFFKKEGA